MALKLLPQTERLLSGTITALLSDVATTVTVSNPPTKFPCLMELEPRSDNAETVRALSAAGSIVTIERGVFNGGVGVQHTQNTAWKQLWGAKNNDAIVDALESGYLIIDSSYALTKNSATVIKITGVDYTDLFTANRVVRINGSSIGVVASSTLTTGNTVITLGYGTVPTSPTSLELAIGPKAGLAVINSLNIRGTTEITAILDEDNMVSDSPVAVPTQQSVKAYVDNNAPIITSAKYAPQGFLINGKIVPSVTSNNLTVAIKTLAGADPSATDIVYIRIGNTVRSITAALSITKNAGTNWCNAGSVEAATRSMDFFVYLGYNATDGVTLGFSRIPYAALYSDFSATSTDEKYCAISTITNAAAGDNYENIGRFEATLSGTSAFNWSQPTYTNANLINRPIFETRTLVWAPVFTGFSSAPTGTISYRVRNNTIIWSYGDAGAGTSNATGFTFTVPFLPLVSSAVFCGPIFVKDNGVNITTATNMQSTAATRAVTVYKTTLTAGSFTGSGSKDMYWSGQTYLI